MRCLVTGSAGMFGESMRRAFKNDDMIYTDKAELDVSNYNSVMEILTKLDGEIDYVIHLAAETDLEFCEKNPWMAYYTNATGTMNMVKLAEILRVPIVYISTAGVFLGEKNCYDENDIPEPANHYGRSKWYGEIAVRTYPMHYIFRMSWAFGGGPDLDKKFVNKIVRIARSGATEIKAISDVYGSPTYEFDVAQTIRSCLCGKLHFGTYHASGIGKASRFDVAREIVDILGLDVEVVPVHADYFSREFPCQRATSEVLVSHKCYPSAMREWRSSLKEYLETYYHA